MSSVEDLDCIVIGGGVAGLSAALVLGRARRRVLLVDAGEQSNLAADGIGGLLGSDRRPPAELYERGRRELETYPRVEVRDGRARSLSALADGSFEVIVEGRSPERSTTLLLAMGMEYRHPELPGLAERWGHATFHCPFCHGWEVAGRPLGVLGATEEAAMRAVMLMSWSDDVTLFTDGADPAALDAETRARLTSAGIAIEKRELAELRGPGRELESAGFADGSERPLGGLLVQTELHQRSPLAADLGPGFASPNPVVKEGIRVDGRTKTSMPGVYAAGDASTQMPSIQNAIAAGAMAGAAIVGELTIERSSAGAIAG